MKSKYDMKNGGIEKALSGLGFNWKYDGNCLYAVDCRSYDALIFSSDEFPKRYEIAAIAYLPEYIEDKQLFMETVTDTMNSNGYPDISSELEDGHCRLSLYVKYRSRYISKKTLEGRLSYFSEAYNFFAGNVLVREDADKWLAANPEKSFMDFVDEEINKSLTRHLASEPRKNLRNLQSDSSTTTRRNSIQQVRITANEQGSGCQRPYFCVDGKNK